MLKINENKTIKELHDKGFIFGHFELLYEIKEGVYLTFNLNAKADDYLNYIGEHCFFMIRREDYEDERLKTLEELKESGFVIDVKD